MSINNIQNKYSKAICPTNEVRKNPQSTDVKKDGINEKTKLKEQNSSQNSDKIKKYLAGVTDRLNEMVKVFNRKIDFVVHDETKRTMVKVIDTVSGKILREIPPEEILDLVAKMQEAFGIIFDVKV